MKMGKSILFLLLIALQEHLTCTSAQSEGDVRLEDGPDHNLGRLEIFWQGKWSTFCGLSIGGAQAACRQLGYIDFISYKPLDTVNPNLNITEAEPETPIAIDHTVCPRSFSNGLLHVLRCGYSFDVASDCSHSNDIVLQCQNTSLWTHPYENQIRLTSGGNDVASTSSGTLEIYLNGKWGNVCSNDFKEAAADSACRQIGYTSASGYTSTSKQPTDVVWISKVSCKGNNEKSCDCFSGCFGSTPTNPTTCPRDDVTHVTCTYDIRIEDKAPPGNRDTCENKESSCDGPLGGGGGGGKLSNGVVVGVVFVVVVVMVLVAIAGAAVMVIIVAPRWKKRDYATINKK